MCHQYPLDEGAIGIIPTEKKLDCIAVGGNSVRLVFLQHDGNDMA